jgi:hypothetical protein
LNTVDVDIIENVIYCFEINVDQSNRVYKFILDHLLASDAIVGGNEKRRQMNEQTK